MLTNFEIMSSHFSAKVNFFSDNVNPKLRDLKKLKLFIEFIFKNEKVHLKSINYIFCADKKLREINKEYLNHNYFTDVITFRLSNKNEPIQSEVYISIDRVKENATNLKLSYKSEIHRVIVHGALHLCGYSDKKKNDKQIMRSREDFYLFKYLPSVSRDTPRVSFRY